MSEGANSQISFGVVLGENADLPWEEVGLEEWWVTEALKYEKPAGLKTYGEVLDHKAEFSKQNPFPFDVIEYFCYDSTRVLLAVKNTYREAKSYTPLPFLPEELIIPEKGEAKLKEFFETHLKDITYRPNWYLSGYVW